MKITRRKFIKSGLLASLGVLFLDAFWFEKYVIDWNYFDISKQGNNKIKIIQISDLHLITAFVTVVFSLPESL